MDMRQVDLFYESFPAMTQRRELRAKPSDSENPKAWLRDSSGATGLVRGKGREQKTLPGSPVAVFFHALSPKRQQQ